MPGLAVEFYKALRAGERAKCETILDVEKSAYRKTPKNTVLWVEPSPFWRACGLRRSVLTAFLRSGLNYSVVGDNFDDAMFSDAYAENRQTGSFILIDRSTLRTAAAGMVVESLDAARDVHRHAESVTPALRAELKAQQPLVVWLTGLPPYHFQLACR